MKIEWNWGTKLLAAMILFMVLLLTLVFMSMRQTYHLVEKDYYPKALEYQGKIDKTSNAGQLGEKIRIEPQGDQVVFTFPSSLDPGVIAGSIVFYRPSDEHLDRRFEIRPDTAGVVVCDVSTLPRGKYVVKVDYQAGDVGYYQEETLLLKMN